MSVPRAVDYKNRRYNVSISSVVTPGNIEDLRDLKDFRCYPFTMLVVGPSGEVFYPCLEIGHFAGNIMEPKTLHRLRREAEETFGPQPVCDNRCHSPCALGFSLLFKNPFPYIYEDYLMKKAPRAAPIGSPRRGAYRVKGVVHRKWSHLPSGDRRSPKMFRIFRFPTL